MHAPSSKTAFVICNRLPLNGSDCRLWFAAAMALVIVLAIPFFLVDVPPVLDYPNHLARYFVLAHPDDVILSQMYAPHWTILPNLGMDAIGTAVLRVTDVHVGGRILLALSLFAPVIGVVVYHRVVFGRYSYWSLASGLTAYNGAFFLGFMNFLLSLGLALIGGAAWIALRRRKWVLGRIVIGAFAAVLIFFCHIFGVFLFALLIGGDEVDCLWERRRSGALMQRDVLYAAGTLVAAISPVIVLYFLSPLGERVVLAGEWRGLAKLWTIFAPFMTTSAELTLMTGVAVVSLLILIRPYVQLAPGMPLIFVVLVLAFVVAPSTIKGGTFVDLRFALMIGLALFAGVQPRLLPLPAILVVAVGAFIVLRSGYIGMTWFDHRHDLADVRAAIAMVEPGARVIVARGQPGHLTDVRPPERALPGIYRLDGHIAALLVIERHAFWPLLFADSAQQPLIVKPPFDQIAQPLSEPVEWPLLGEESFSAEMLRNARYLSHWRASFDNVLLIDPATSLRTPRGLLLVYRGRYAQLFRIDR
jgi:hypothetical protein